MWMLAAVLSAAFAGLTAILEKCGKTDSDIATALRTVVVLLFAWIMVLVVGSGDTITDILPKSFLFLILSGIATGGSWMCYFKALSLGEVNKVAAIDKSSTVLSVLLAILCFGETEHLAVKLIGALLLGIGIFLMTDPKIGKSTAGGSAYVGYAVGSAVFAALTTILAKVGITGVESNLGTAIRTVVVVVMAWLMVFWKGKEKQLKAVSPKELVYLILSGVTTGVSWLCYYYAIQNGVVSIVVPIDKMSILLTVTFSYLVFRETLRPKAAAGLCLMTVGTVGMAIFA